MNDRFRIRAWDKSFRRMIYNIFFFWKENTITVYELHKDASKSYLPNSHIVLEQCTGLKDKNGKLIYEGDIVKLDSEQSDIHIAKVIYRNGCFYLSAKKWVSPFNFLKPRRWKIIGNIHENQELLEDL